MERAYESSLAEHSSELGHHFFEALPAGSVRKAIDYLRAAAERATTSLAYEDSIGIYQKTLRALDYEQPSSPEMRTLILLDLAEAEHRVGRSELSHNDFIEARKIARATKRPELIARSVLGIGLLPGTPGAVDYHYQ